MYKCNTLYCSKTNLKMYYLARKMALSMYLSSFYAFPMAASVLSHAPPTYGDALMTFNYISRPPRSFVPDSGLWTSVQAKTPCIQTQEVTWKMTQKATFSQFTLWHLHIFVSNTISSWAFICRVKIILWQGKVWTESIRWPAVFALSAIAEQEAQ